MSNKSDNSNKPRTSIFELLPEVYRSDTNETVFESSFNRHLTKDDLARVSGFVGARNASALVDRQIKEPSPYRQAFQLQPTMYTKIGNVDNILTQPGFLQQLSLMGVDIDRIQKWANTEQFNWVPPINIDMLVNYFDYFWPGNVSTDPAQYITIENRCNKAKSKTLSYENLINKKGHTHAILSVDPKTNTYVIAGDLSDVLETGVIFFTKNSANVNVNNHLWTSASSSYDSSTNETTIVTQEDIAIVLDSTDGSAPPTTSQVGRWWYAPDIDTLYVWNGTIWLPSAVFFTGGDISLTELLAIYERDSNCICNEDYGWDIAQWDDNQLGNVLWNRALLTAISHATEGDWITANGAPVALDLWYDTSEDILKQWDGVSWISVVSNFSAALLLTTGNVRWDATVGCEAQELNQWSEQNQWQHKTEVASFGNVKRAQLPIIEFNSTIEQNEWTRVEYGWKYRALSYDSFESVSDKPTRLELEPIKDYGAIFDGGKWYIYLFTTTATLNRDTDHTATFVPGFQFRIVDDLVLNEVYTVARSEYRRITVGDTLDDQINVLLTPDITDYYVTLVELQEPVFTAPTTGSGITNVRIESTTTSKGDTWTGYHVHWLLDLNTKTTSAATNQPLNPVLVESRASTLTPAVVPDGLVVVGLAHQEFTATVAGVTTVSLDPSFYFGGSSGFYATPGSGELRVYVNGIRQYGTYTETTNTGSPNYTLVGSNVTFNADIEYVEEIVLDEPLEQFDVVLIEICPPALADMGMFSVPVRTVEDDGDFTTDLGTGDQPVYMSLSTYRLTKQVKTQTNQYPMFNVYDVCTGDIVDASPIFAYEELADNPINSEIGFRITSIDSGRDYTFMQYLLERDNGQLYGYRNFNNAPEAGTFWYSPLNNTLKYWDGYAWLSSAPMTTVAGGTVYRTAVISATDPTELHGIDSALWFDTLNQELKRWETVTADWVEITDVVINSADPTLQTVWKTTSPVPYEYVPDYVDGDREPIAIGDPTGDWEMLDQWFYNPEHKNRSSVNYTQLVSHFSSIVRAQAEVPGLLSGGVFSMTQNQYDYGVGGTIKEHNYSFDTLVSAVNATNVNPVGLMEWVEDQYVLGLLLVRDELNRNIASILGSYSTETLLDLSGTAANTIIDSIQQNDFLALVYGDTTAYDSSTQEGMPNWVASAPMLGLSEKFRPHIVSGNGFVELFHHDGHRSRILYTAGEVDRFAKQLIGITDTRIAGQTLGKQGSTLPPYTHAGFLSTYGGSSLRAGVYWYRVTGSTNTLYRFTPYSISAVAPSFYYDGDEIADGIKYYNSMTQKVFEKSGLSWVEIATGGDITDLWEVVDFATVLAEINLEIENRLYDMVPQRTELVFDYSTLTPDVYEQAAYDAEYEKRFYAFVAERNITAPLVNVDYVATNAFTWNYSTSTITTDPRTDIAPDMAACWQELYTRWYGTPYPHLEPWKLQGYHDKPTWWDDEYLDTTGTRRWIYDHGTTTGMWENIRIGAIPVGRELPDGTGNGTGSAGDVSVTYNYFSVNIGDTATVDGYAVDGLLPPYYATSDIIIRSLFTSFATEIVAPEADYIFGLGGPIEWQWKVSSEYVYDLPIIAFIMQPMKFLHSSFGINFIEVDNLQIDPITCQVYSHENVMFHGDVYNTNQTYLTNGLNQWYVNYNRFSGYDTNGEFRALWAGWTPHLSYSFAGIFDTETFSIATKYFDITSEDYDIHLANTGIFKEVWSDGFQVSLLSVPPSIVQYNNQGAWRFDLSLLSSVTRTINAYGVKQYPFVVDTSTDVCTAYRYNIVEVSTTSSRFYINGNHTTTFTPGSTFTVSASTANDGTYTVLLSAYDSSSNRTYVNVNQPVPSSVADGRIDVAGFVVPWQTGQRVIVTSSKLLPTPLVEDESYFIIATGGKTFKLAETVNDALNGIDIDFTTLGNGELFVGEPSSSFYVYGGAAQSKELWYHYAIDTTKILNIVPPTTVVGIQNLINIIDGYVAYQQDAGIKYNIDSNVEVDADTGRTISWQFEIERFIDWAYSIRRSRVKIADKFAFSVNGTAPTDTLVFDSSAIPSWTNGDVIVFESSGSLPAPLLANVAYYFVQTEVSGTFKVSTSSNANITSSHITLTTSGGGTMYVSRKQNRTSFPAFEINPARNNVWVDTPQGLLSNVIAGPYADIRTTQTLFDQYGRPITADKINVFRNDTITRIAIRPEVVDDVTTVPPALRTQYDYLHMGGGHFFLEGYEHVLLFNDYTTDGSLIYDQFLGLHTTSFDLDYYEGENYTLRPTLGGHYLIGDEFRRNIEGSIVDLQNYYDAYDLREGSTQAKYARNLLGYTGSQHYLDLVNMNDKAQFLFYRGMIQHKGSVAGARAYINSRRFIDAKIDEFWAWKIAEFGDSRAKNYPEIKLTSTDAVEQDIRMHFLSPAESTSDSDVVAAVTDNFIPVSWTDSSRWEIYPEQRAEILHSMFLDMDVTSMWKITTEEPISGHETKVDYWLDTTTLKEWDGTTWTAATNAPISVVVDGTTYYVRLDQSFDAVHIVNRVPVITGNMDEYLTSVYTEGTDFDIINSETVKLDNTKFVGVLIFFTLNSGFSKNNPSKIVDKKSRTMVSNVQLWDPARDHHSTYAIHNVDLQTATDPAKYSISFDSNLTADNIWNNAQVGKIWLDMNTLGYNRYYDTTLYPDVSDRLNTWGTLAPWANVDVYEWVASSVPPEDYADLVTKQATSSMSQRAKATGTARQTLFKRTRESYVATITGIDSGDQSGLPAAFVAGSKGRCDVTFAGTPTGANPTGLSVFDPGPFQANVYIDGDAYLISVTSVSAPTYDDLKTEIETQLLGTADVDITLGNLIRIISKTTGNGSTVVIQDINLFSSLNINPAVVQTPVDGVSTPYTQAITIDGTAYNVTVSGDDISSISDLATAIENQIGASIATATVSGPDIVITSASVGPNSTVSIGAGTIFTSTGVADVGAYGKINTAGTFNVDDLVLFTSTDTLPVPLEAGVKYLVTDTTGGLSLSLDGEDVNIETTGTGTLSIVPEFKSSDWIKSDFVRETQYGIDIAGATPTFEPVLTLTNAQWSEYDVADVYYNDQLIVNSYQIDNSKQIDLADTGITVSDTDFIDIVRPLKVLTEDETAFDPDSEDDGTTMVQWKYDYQYAFTTKYQGTTPVTTYYFWVKDSQRKTSGNTALSAFEIALQLETIPTPYFVVQYPKAYAPSGNELLSELDLPIFYRQAVLRNASKYITEDLRYVWQFTRDLTLRNMTPTANRKSKHQEWYMFRREQPASVPRELWDRLTEAVVGYTLDDDTVRVPSLERELYDADNNTDTRYGLGEGQAFCDGEYALATILQYLQDPNIDFGAINVDSFFATYSFDTPENIKTAMNAIYDTFGAEHVNNIWFETLMDALSTRSKYKELLKTSWIALHGIRILEVAGVFD